MNVRVNELVAVEQISILIQDGQSVDYVRGYAAGLWVAGKLEKD